MIKPLRLSQVVESTRSALNAKLHGQDVTFTRVTTDSRQLRSGDLFIALRGERFDGHDFIQRAADQGAVGAVVEQVNQQVSLPQLEVSDALLALGQMALLNRAEFHGPLVAITGSCGKTTVKAMVAEILRQRGQVLATQGNLNNHIGVPLTLLQLQPEHEFAVIEMGASAGGEIGYLCALAQPSIAMINNVMPAHIEGFGSIEGVARAKGEIYRGLVAGGVAVVNIDDRFAPQWLPQVSDKKLIKVSLVNQAANCFAKDVEHFSDGTRFILVFNGKEIDIDLNAMGEHSVRNALMAAACAAEAGASFHHIQTGLANFTPVGGRMNALSTPSGATVIDDSYNANPGSVRAAIDVLSAQAGETILVLGDMAELGAEAASMHAEIGAYAKQKNINRLLTLGDLSCHASDAFGAAAQHFTDFSQLVSALVALSLPGTRILVKGSRSARMDRIVSALTDSSSGSLGETH